MEMRLSRAEYALLGGVMGASNLIGLADPFPGLLADEIRDRLAVVRQGLIDRGLMQMRGDHRILIAPQVGATMSVCAFPEVTFLLTVNRLAASPVQYCFFAAAQGTVRMHQVGEDVVLLPLESPSAVGEQVATLLGLRDAPSGTLAGGSVSQAELSAARTAIAQSGVDGGSAVLCRAGATPAFASALAAALSAPVVNASLAVLRAQGRDWQTDGFGLLAGPDGVWRLSPGGDGRVTFTPASAATLLAEVADLVAHALPQPLAAWGAQAEGR